MISCSDVESKNEKAELLDMLLNAFLSPGPVKIIMEIGKRGKVEKTKLMDIEKAVRRALYAEYEEAFIEADLIKIEKMKDFPYSHTVELTDKGKQLYQLLLKIEKLVNVDNDQLRPTQD